MINDAIIFAAQAHAGQVRKYTGEPYVLHPIEVMNLVRLHAADWTEPMLVAALLHDVIEDTRFDGADIVRQFGTVVAGLVIELTDEYTHESYPTMNRVARKTAERGRMEHITPQAQTIKLADLISNTRSIAARDPGFARIYLREKAAVLPLLNRGDPDLLALAHRSLVLGAIKADVQL